MIGYLRGALRARTEDGVLVDVGGVGYEVAMAAPAAAALAPDGREVSLFVHTLVREDAITLFGFRDAEERGAFRALIAVNGVGPRLALAVMSGLDARSLSRAIATADVRRLSSIPGIGRKTAERLVLELKDKLPSWGDEDGAEADAAPEAAAAPAGTVAGDLALALQTLGYRKAEIDRILKGIRPGPDDTVEDLLRRALRELATR